MNLHHIAHSKCAFDNSVPGNWLRGYRFAAYDELPRTGLPELFRTEEEYSSYVRRLTSSGVRPDESYIWWAMRPSSRHSTLELRAPDSCTILEDAMAIAALYRVLAAHLDRVTNCDANITNVDRAIAVENKWRAQRYGVSSTFASKDGAVSLKGLIAELVRELAPEAEMLSSSAELEHTQRSLSARHCQDRFDQSQSSANAWR